MRTFAVTRNREARGPAAIVVARSERRWHRAPGQGRFAPEADKPSKLANAWFTKHGAYQGV